MVPADGRGVLGEALVSWVSVYGIYTTLRVYWKQTTHSRLERCASFLLECLGALLLVRGFFWITGYRVFGAATFLFAAVVPLAVVLYVEALLRRHLPLAAKVLVLVGTVGFAALALAGRLHADPFWLRAFTGYVFLLMIVMTGTLAFRDRSDLTAIEDRAADAIAVAVVLIVPFVMTDLATDLGFHTVRVGSVGILMFVHATVIASEPRGTARTVLAGHLMVIGLATLLGAIEAYVIGDLRPATVARSGSFFACILLLIMIYLRVHAHGQIARGPGLVRSISSADTRTTESFLQVLERLPIVAGYRLLRPSDLLAYDHWAFPTLFPADGTHVITRRQLRHAPGIPSDDTRYRADQLADLLEREGMTHAVLIRENPVVLLLVHVPSAGLEQSALAQLGLVRTVAEAIERGRGDA
jgi:hypothetical protein